MAAVQCVCRYLGVVTSDHHFASKLLPVADFKYFTIYASNENNVCSFLFLLIQKKEYKRDTKKEKTPLRKIQWPALI